MRKITIRWLAAFCFSTLLSYIWPLLPPLFTLFLLFCALTLAAVWVVVRASPLTHCLRMPVFIAHGLTLGALWMASVGHWYYAWQLPRDSIQQDVVLTGIITGAQCDTSRQRYTMAVSTADSSIPGHRLIRLYEQHHNPCLRPGDHLTAIVRLKPAYGVANPIGFNFQQFLVSRGIVATGRLIQRQRTISAASTTRQRVRGILDAHAGEHHPWLLLLLLGYKDALASEDWALLRRTGTGHLFSISGLHLGLVTTALFPALGLIMAGLIRLVPQLPMQTARVATLLLMMMAAWQYTLLTGGALPVVRAGLLLCLGLLVCLAKRCWAGTHIALFMLLGCLLSFPLALLSPGFTLSVGAVALIWLVCWRWHWHRLRWYQALWRLQSTLSLCLLPVSLSWFSLLSLSSLPVNLIMVPAMTVILPLLLVLVFVACALPAFAGDAIGLADWLTGALLGVLEQLDSWLPAPLAMYPEPSVMVALVVAGLLACVPPFYYRRTCIVLLLMPLALSAVPFSGDSWYVHVFDAGQGTAVLVTRGQRAVLIDTGRGDADSAPTIERGLIPFLVRHRLQLDTVILSHMDNDHAGGAAILRDYLARQRGTVRWISPQQGCVAGRTLSWQGLTVSMLWPPEDSSLDSNNGSCVIAVSGDGHSVLLPGDIERAAEYAMLARGLLRHADVVLAPHHGSMTSSTGVFIEAVAPDWVVFSQGFENRWGFPARPVVARYRAQGARLLATSEVGYIRFTLRAGMPIQADTQRGELHPRWYLRARRFHTMD